MSKIEKIIDFLKQNPIQIFSTINNNKVNSRPLGSAMLIKNKKFITV